MDRQMYRQIDEQMDLWMNGQIDRIFIIIVFLSLVSRPPVEVLISSPEGGRVQGMNTNMSLSGVTPPVAINTKNRTIFYYNTNDKYVYRRSLDANLNPEVITCIVYVHVEGSDMYTINYLLKNKTQY